MASPNITQPLALQRNIGSMDIRSQTSELNLLFRRAVVLVLAVVLVPAVRNVMAGVGQTPFRK